ncbi:MAG: response regulator [Firmicutes bacterium]|nr:response regulator [Candidatus Caballimonas caccae]
MNILIVDDEKIVLNEEVAVIKNVVKDADIKAFNKPSEAIEYAKKEKIDVAFLDINMRVINGIAIAQQLQDMYPKVNVIFCTGYEEFSMDAHDLYCSGYLLKPIEEEKVKKALENLRYPIEEKKRISISCFGNFSVFIDNEPIKFKYKKTNELLAYLVDRNGADCSTREIMATIFEDEDKTSYYDNLRVDLLMTLKLKGLSKVIRQNRGTLGIERDEVSCDYFDYLDGKNRVFRGEYMSQFSFGEVTLQNLIKESEKNK